MEMEVPLIINHELTMIFTSFDGLLLPFLIIIYCFHTHKDKHLLQFLTQIQAKE
jgi:hypothetical protein